MFKKYLFVFTVFSILFSGCDQGPATPFAETHTLRYVWNDGSSQSFTAEYAPGEEVPAETQGSYNYAGYSLLCWNTAPDGSGRVYAPGRTFTMPGGDIELHAVWIQSEYLALDTIPGIMDGSYSQSEPDADGNQINTFIHNIPGFSAGRYEVSYMLWDSVRRWAEENGYEFENKGLEGINGSGDKGALPVSSADPVTSINWSDAVKWCNAYSEFSGLVPAYKDGSGSVIRKGNQVYLDIQYDKAVTGYSLLTEGEWQFLASNGVSANFNLSSADPVTDSSTYEFYNVSGSAGEICYDAWFGYPGGTVDDYCKESSNAVRIYRSGAAGVRKSMSAVLTSPAIGFRVKRR